MGDDARWSRRSVLGLAVGAWSASALAGRAFADDPRTVAPDALAGAAPAGVPARAMRVSLAQWSLHKSLYAGSVKPMDFPIVASRDYGIRAVEYVNSFYKDLVGTAGFADALRSRCTDAGVTSALIMCDGEGALGDPDDTRRVKAVDQHKKWLDLAKHLGCHSIRVNAQSSGERAEQAKHCTDGLHRLALAAAPLQLNILVENHGGLSSDGAWLSSVLRGVQLANCGALPDFGNWYEYDRYQGVTDLMPLAKAVSAKSYDFNDSGAETKIDYARMLAIVRAAGYAGWIGVEYEGARLSEADGIKATKALLLKLGCTE